MPAKPDRKGLPWPVFLFVVSLIIPWIIVVGPARLSVYRIVLLATLLPTLVMWASGKAGRVRFADFALLLYPVWCSLSLVIHHGPAIALQPGSILILETAGAYFLARCYIRDADDFYSLVALLFKIVAITFPFAVIEALTGRNVVLEVFGLVFPTPVDTSYDPRWGLRRVQAYLEHPILFGVVTGSILAMVHLVLGYGRPPMVRFLKTGVVAVTTFLSMSAGPVTAITAQWLLLSWNRIFRSYANRWKVLLGLIFAVYLLAEIVSNQSVPEFFITHFSFDEVSAYYRVLIWRFGSASALTHPFFGVGLNEWERPYWMPPSIDMFWLYHAILYGIPAALLMLLAFSTLVWKIGFKKGLTEKLDHYRTAYVISMTGFFLVGWTVHFWNAAYVLFLLLLGSGVWILDTRNEADAASGKQRPGGRRDEKIVLGDAVPHPRDQAPPR